MLPRVKINFSNGALGQVSASADGVIGVLTTGAPVAGKFVLNQTYTVNKFSDLNDVLGITGSNNPGIVKLFTELYNQAGDGAEVWLKAFADTVTMTTMITLATANGVQEMLQLANGRIRTLFLHRTPSIGYTPVITAGLDGDVATAIAAAQITSDWSEATLKAPVLTAIAGLAYSGTASALTDLTTATNNRVCVMIADTVAGSGCALGLLAGKIAIIPVQRNIGRVKDGAIKGITEAYVASTLIDKSDVSLIHDKGYITLRTHIGRSGYFFADDPLAAPVTDDYNHITARRTVDKAYRIAYDTLLNELLEEIPVSDEGKISVAFAKSLETRVENAVVNSMTANGELGNDTANATDNGVICYIDTDQNIIATGKVDGTLKVKPYGYARYIEVKLGFQTLTA